MSCRKPRTAPTSVLLVLFAIVAICLVPATALAYIDPGTGSFVLQGILAAVVGAGVAIKIFWRRITAFFGKDKPAEDDDLDV